MGKPVAGEEAEPERADYPSSGELSLVASLLMWSALGVHKRRAGDVCTILTWNENITILIDSSLRPFAMRQESTNENPNFGRTKKKKNYVGYPVEKNAIAFSFIYRCENWKKKNNSFYSQVSFIFGLIEFHLVEVVKQQKLDVQVCRITLHFEGKPASAKYLSVSP